MKRGILLVISLLIISLMFYVVAQDPPITSGSDKDVAQIKEIIDNDIPLDSSGNFNSSKFAPIKSKAEERIDSINKWFEDSAPWLALVFGIIPAVSLLFFSTVYIWLWLFLNLVLKGNISNLLVKNIWAHWIGLALFITLLITKALPAIAKGVYNLGEIIWNWVLPSGTIISYIVMFLFVVGFIFITTMITQLLGKLSEWIANRGEKKETAEASEQIQEDKEVLHAETEAIQESSNP
ncbi:MAG: hypothetical protein NUV97_01145 [archaeon]|nr:hypothetical protein [archaeon]MCR4323432.1 hypothetical protein [Nanoarchaeota archaeon]